jgi:protein-S-isoprenylcysteine O-methyltransferase Ste14
MPYGQEAKENKVLSLRSISSFPWFPFVRPSACKRSLLFCGSMIKPRNREAAILAIACLFSMSNNWSSVWLALRSLLWTILLPGFFAGYVPWRFFGLGRARFDWFSPACLLGLLCIGLGVVLLAACVFEFARSGQGTLSPLDPPRHLVVRGLYRYVRNPMYVSVTIIVLGEALLIRSVALAIYWAVWFAAANVFVLGYEEPALRRRFGPSYDEYSRKVGRWIPKLHRTQLR